MMTQCGEKAGTELEADGENKQEQPELLYKIECVMINRIPEVSDDDSRKQNASCAESNTAKF